jgi:hypothetical protein
MLAGGTALIGVLLAVLLLRPPDTGGQVTVPERDPKPLAGPKSLDDGRTASTKRDEAPVKVDRGEPEVLPERVIGRPIVSSGNPDAADELREKIYNPNPMAAEAAAKRALPEAVQAGKASVPWTLIRRNLLRLEDPAAKELGGQANQLVLDLRKQRRDPDSFDYAGLEKRQKELGQQIRETSFVDDPEIIQMLGRLDEVQAEYHELKNEGGE